MSDDDYVILEVVNLTGHDIRLGPTRDASVNLTASGMVRIEPHYQQMARVRVFDRGLNTGITIPILQAKNGNPIRVPEPKPNTLYVVSGMVESVLTEMGRTDFVCSARIIRERRRNTGVEPRRVLAARALLTHTEVEQWRERYLPET